MPYFNNCQYGINSQNKSTVNINNGYFTNMVNSAIDSNGSSVVIVVGTTGGTGFTGDITGPNLFIAESNAGINLNNSYFTGSNCILLNNRYNLISNTSSFLLRNSTINKSSSEVNTYGVQADNGSVGVIGVGVGITGFPSATGNTSQTGGSLLSSINESVLYVSDSTLAALVNVSQGYIQGSTVVGTPFKLVQSAGVQRIPGDQFPFDY